MGSRYTQVGAVREMLEKSERDRLVKSIPQPPKKKKRSKISKWIRGSQ